MRLAPLSQSYPAMFWSMGGLGLVVQPDAFYCLHHSSTCEACHIDKVKCKWIAGSHADSEEGSSFSRVVASSSQVASLPQVASLSRVSRSSPPQPEVHASVDALWEIAEAICDVQCGQEE